MPGAAPDALFMEEAVSQTSLPLDVVQIVLGYVGDTKALAAARQTCSSWRTAAAAAPCTLRVVLPASSGALKSKLALLQQVAPGMAGCVASIAGAVETPYAADAFTQLASFPGLRALELKFADSHELSSDALAALAGLSALTSLQLHNVSLASSTETGSLTHLTALRELSLVHHSKVSALMVGDAHLQVIGELAGLQRLVLQGRMCSATDDGLLALSSLSGLRSLSISWVPWQSQITQRAALHLLSALKQLSSLQLGGAELLLPTTPYYPVAGGGGAAAVAGGGGGGGAPVLGIGVMGQQQGLIAAAVAAVADNNHNGGGPAGGAVPAAAGLQGEHMRRVLSAKATELEVFKLQFNCCGTGVEKALLSLGDVRQKLTGLQWSYAKLSGPSSVSLLGSCTSLRSLKLRLWYQDYNLAPFELNLLDLSQLVHLRTLVVDKRPPFQQQLPAQQSAISLPITAPMLGCLARAWPHLQKLQLGLARGDFGFNCLAGLAGFTCLQSLSVHCYDQGYDDGHFMLPIDVASLPASLLKLDLMHAELFSSSAAGAARLAKRTDGGATCGGSYSQATSSLGAACSGSGTGACSSAWKSSGGASSSSCASSSGGGGSGGSRPVGRIGLAATSAFVSMLSESFSVLSRQASAECSTAFLDQLYSTQQRQPGGQGGGGSGGSAQPAASSGSGAPLTGAVSLQNLDGSSRLAPVARMLSLDSSGGGWLQDLVHEPAAQDNTAAPPAAAAEGDRGNSRSEGGALPAAAAAATLATPSSSGSRPRSMLSRQNSLPPLPQRQQHGGMAAAQQATYVHTRSKQAINNSMVTASRPQLAAGLAATATVDSAAADSTAAAGPAGEEQQRRPVPSRPVQLQNPFAAAAAAAAVHAELGGCMAAVESPAACDDMRTGDGPQLLPLMAHPAAGVQRQQSRQQQSQAAAHSTSEGGACSRVASGSTLAATFSVSVGVARSTDSGKAGAGTCDDRSCSSRAPAARLPLLQQLQLKHCTLDGLCLDDIITSPQELCSLQLVELFGLQPRDIALMPFLAHLQRLTLIAAKEDSWLGLAPLRLLSKLPALRHLDWVVSERALPARNKGSDLQVLARFPKLQVLTLHTLLGRCEALHAVSGQLASSCHVRLMTPAYCEHASRKAGSRIGRLLGAASCLIPGSVPTH